MKWQVHIPRLQKKWILFAGVVLLIGGGFLYQRTRPKPQTQSVIEVQKSSIRSTLEVSGKVDAQRKAILKFLGGGKLVSLPQGEGMSVRKGAVIAAIDARDLQKSLKKTLNDYSTERADFEQNKEDRAKLVQTNAVLRLLQQDQWSLENSVTDVEIRTIALQNASLVAPFDGVITALPVKSTGVHVTATDGFELIDPGSLIFEGEVDEVDVGFVRSDLPVEIRLDAYPTDVLTGYIESVGLKARTSASSGGTVFPVTVHIQSTDVLKYRLGLNGTMTIITGQKDDVLTVPIEATIKRDDKVYVQVVQNKNGKEVTIEKEIQIGMQSDDAIEVTSGLSQGDRIAVPN